MKLLDTNNKNDLKKFAQALMILNYHDIVTLKDITLLEFSGTNVTVDYLLFRVGNITYKYRNRKISIDLVETH